MPEYMAARLCSVLSDQLGISFAKEEQSYLHKLLIETEQLIHSTRLLPVDDLVLLDMVRSLMDQMQGRMGYAFQEDRLLREGLIAHMQPVMERIGGRQSIRNPLLQQIRKDYDSLFGDVKNAVHDAWPDTDVPDEWIPGHAFWRFDRAIACPEARDSGHYRVHKRNWLIPYAVQPVVQGDSGDPDR